jgi:peptidoglycan/LPS O-acetylase OafA/YrhL
MIHQPATISRGVYTITFIVVLGIVLLRVNQHGRTQLAAGLFATGLLALMTTMAVTAGGVHSPGVTMYFMVVLMVGLLLGEANPGTPGVPMHVLLKSGDRVGEFPE